MLLYNTLMNKPITYLYDSDTDKKVEALDLLGKSVYPIDESDTMYYYNWYDVMYGAKPVIVTKEYVARPDLLSQYAYKTDEYADLICKLNGLSNPFELNEDMLILLPSQDKLKKIVCTDGTACEKISENANSTNTDTICQIDKSNRKLLNEKRSPAEATINDVNYVIRKDLGMVFY